MVGVEQVAAAVAGGDRQGEAFGEAVQGGAASLVPPAAAGDHDGTAALGQHGLELRQGARVRARLDRAHRTAVGGAVRLAQHVAGQADHHGSRPPRHGGREGAADQLSYTCRMV